MSKMWLSSRQQFSKACKACSYFKRTVKTAATRVRFAPSPTGYLHLGGLRTALYNHLFAKSRNGVFILRIEDTDQTRKVEGSVAALIDDLNWAGIECHERPNNAGAFGPYVQSERLHIYQEHIQKLLDNGSAYKCFCTDRRLNILLKNIFREHIQKLLDNGSAYKCFCTDRRLNILRRDAVKRHQVPKYDNKCRSLSNEEVKAKIKSGTPYCVRFKLSSDCQSFEDMIFGGIAYDVSLNEGDPVLMKSDGFPTYHFANVVDDHLMQISHVLRGVEWQISTTKHLLIYRAFGWTPPQFGHLPLIVNADGTKLSKRQSDVRVEDYRNKGVYPLALVNYITMAGGGFDHVAGAGVSLKAMDQLAAEFQVDKINSHPSRLNPDLLEECNRLEIKRRLLQDDTSKALVEQLQKLIQEKYPHENLNISEDHIRNVLNWATARISRIEELVSSKFGFLWILPSQNNLEIKRNVLEKLVNNLENIDNFEQNSLKENLKRFSSENEMKFPVLMKMLRSALSGLDEGPSVAEMMQLLGKRQSLDRIKAVMK